MPSRTVTVTIERPPAIVVDFARDPGNLPRWATAFCRSVRKTPDGWVVETPDGDAGFRFVETDAAGVLDHVVTLADGTVVVVPMRVVATGKGSEVALTVVLPEGVTDHAFEADVAMVVADLGRLRAALEGMG